MGTPHKHRDVIIAWANGGIVQYRFGAKDKWKTYNEIFAPSFDERTDYRIKNNQVTKTGWINIYRQAGKTEDQLTETEYFSSDIWKTKKIAKLYENEFSRFVTCVRIEWEEEA